MNLNLKLRSDSYFNNRAQICVYERYKYLNSIKLVPWNYVSRVIYLTDEPVECPICLNPVRLPRIDKCGHILCLTCILSIFKLSLNDYSYCPVCKTYELSKTSIKRTRIINIKTFNEGERISLNLLAKGISSSVPHAGTKLISQYSNQLCHSQDFVNYSYVSYDHDKRTENLIDYDSRYVRRHRKYYEENIGEEGYTDLLNHLHDEMCTFFGSLRITNKDYEFMKQESGIKLNILRFKEQRNLFKMFYQCSSLRYIFLDQSEVDKILDEYTELNRDPPVKITGNILSTVQVVANDVILKKYNIQHIPLGTTITWIKLDPVSIKYDYLFGDKLKKLRNNKVQTIRVEKKLAEQEKLKIKNRLNTDIKDRYLPNIIRNQVMKEIGATESAWEKEQEKIDQNSMVVGFNTCMLGIECVSPDPDAPHAIDCIHYVNPYLNDLNMDEESNDSMSDSFENGPPETPYESCEEYFETEVSELTQPTLPTKKPNTNHIQSAQPPSPPLPTINGAACLLITQNNEKERQKLFETAPRKFQKNAWIHNYPTLPNDNPASDDDLLLSKTDLWLDKYLVPTKPKSQREMKNKRKEMKSKKK